MDFTWGQISAHALGMFNFSGGQDTKEDFYSEDFSQIHVPWILLILWQVLLFLDSHPKLPVTLKNDFFFSASFYLVLVHTV